MHKLEASGYVGQGRYYFRMTEKPESKRVAPIKMVDLAKLAGVSKSTVSRALAGSPLIPQVTKKRIQDLAKEHHYRLNKRARNFRSSEAMTIAVLIPNTREKDWRLSDPFFLELLGSIAEALNEMGHELLLTRAPTSIEDWVEDHVRRGACDGVILIGQGTQHDEINRMVEGGTPFVVWGGKLEDQRYCTVGSDNRHGGQIATEHMLDKGRRNIAFLGDLRLPEVQLRYRGYCDALQGAGLTPDPEMTLDTPFSGEVAYQKVCDFLALGYDVDGIFACSDVIAMATVRACHEHGLDVPKACSLVGYDDIALSSFSNPPLTTVRQDCSSGGRELVERLLRLIQGHDIKSLVLETELIIRASS